MEDHEPNHGFVDSRRLTGPNRYFAGPAVILTPRGVAAGDPVALQEWAQHVRAMAAALGWPDPQPRVERRKSMTLLVFGSPPDAQLTATEVNEWAWERAAAAAGETGFDLAQPLGDDAAAVLAARAAAESRPALVALRAAAALRGLPILEDDETLSIGAGSGSRSWPRDTPPAEVSVPWETLRDVPTVLVTGSNGKTTTVRVLAAMAAAAGLTPGLSSTEGVFVDGALVERGDYSGPAGARLVLRDARVQAAVLETARGGILRRGLAVGHADAAVVTNIRADHFGEYGVENAEDLAETKLVVARVLGRAGTLVLNADDTTLMAVAARLTHVADVRCALVAADDAHPSLVALRNRGGATCAVRAGRLILHDQGFMADLGEIRTMPLTHGGAAPYNVANLAAAVLAARAMGLSMPPIIATLRRFGAAPGDNPGRLERWQHRGATVLLDYAHNPDALAQLLRTARALNPARLFLLLGQAGNREDDAIADLAHAAAGFAPDGIVIKELPQMLRGRAPGEMSARLEEGLRAAGVAPAIIRREADEETAARLLLSAARAGDVIVLPVHTALVRERLRGFLQERT